MSASKTAMVSCKTIIISLLILVGTFIAASDGAPPPKATNPARLQLLKDALGWMTFRRNGQLMTEAQLKPLFLDPLLEKYHNSNFYRTFVIAFEQGVLPRLTLQENDICDPGYTLKYKDPFNSSVTPHYQQTFTFGAFDSRFSSGDHFCDYRQGLICKPSTSRCQCPEGSLMQSIDGNKGERRCLLEENETCALIDMDHGWDQKHTDLASNLVHMIFNLEKPPGCKMGTQCRFKQSNLNTPLCYDSNNGPWSSGTRLGFGSECALGLYATPGACERLVRPFGSVPGYICYNFGPLRSQRSSNPETRIGFCAHEYGPYGIANGINQIFEVQISYTPYFSPFVHPRTVPLRGSELETFLRRFFSGGLAIPGHTFSDVEATSVGDACSVQKTKKWEDVWTYFSSLAEDPPPTADYVVGATKQQLDTHLDAAIDLPRNPKEKICKVYLTFMQYDPEEIPTPIPALKCVPEGTPDANGNDGKCREPGNLDTTAHATRFQSFLDATSIIERDQPLEKTNYRVDMIEEFPEVRCSPSLDSHLKILHLKLQKFQCSVCSKRFGLSGDLKRHEMIHRGEKSCSCIFCDKCFRHNCNLDVHLRRHINEKPYPCDLCDRSYVEKAELQTHRRMHTGEMGFKCRFCPVAYYDRYHLTAHCRAVHGKEIGKRYICVFCNRDFISKAQLDDHILGKIGEKPYPCGQCDKSFATSSDRLKHTRRIHGGVKNHKCNFCEETFFTVGAMAKHEEGVHQVFNHGQAAFWAEENDD